MATLLEMINSNGMRPSVVNDCVDVLEQEVNKKKGMSGFATKQGFQIVRKLENGRMINNLVDKLLNEFVVELEPYYVAYLNDRSPSRPSFQDYLAQRDEQVSQSLLNVTDRRRNSSSNKLLIQTYDSLRSSALRNVKESVPALGGLMEKYAFQTA